MSPAENSVIMPSLINLVLPIVAILGAIAIGFSIIAAGARGIVNGIGVPSFLAALGGFIIFIIAIVTVAIAGFIMFMYAMYSLSNYYSEPAIFKNVLYAFLLSIVSAGVTFALYFAVILSMIGDLSLATTPPNPQVFPQFILAYVVVIVVSLAIGIVDGVLYMRAFNKLKEKSGVDNFGTAGLLYIIGVFIPFVIWIAWIFAALGFKKLKAAPASSPNVSYYSQPPPLSSTIQTKRCPNCGTENKVDAIFCGNCGKLL